MLDLQQQGALRYEERVRLERANGLRKDENPCDGYTGVKTPHNEDDMKGMTYADLAKTPLKMNAVCPHAKVIVPVQPSFVVSEPVTQIEATYAQAGYRVVDFNPCDGRSGQGVLNNIPKGVETEITHAKTVTGYGVKVEDTLYDEPNAVKYVKSDVENIEGVKQPIAVNGTEPDNTITTDSKSEEKDPSAVASEPEE